MRQQRNQDSIAIYRPKEQNTTKDESSPASTIDSSSFKSNTSTPSSNNTSATNSPLSPRSGLNSSIKHITNDSTDTVVNNSATAISIKSPLRTDKPIQKVTPSRNSTPIKYHQQVTSPTNGNVSSISSKLNSAATKDYNAYVKPCSPTKPNTNSNGSSNGSPAPALSIAKPNGLAKAAQKSPLYVLFLKFSNFYFVYFSKFGCILSGVCHGNMEIHRKNSVSQCDGSLIDKKKKPN